MPSKISLLILVQYHNGFFIERESTIKHIIKYICCSLYWLIYTLKTPNQYEQSMCDGLIIQMAIFLIDLDYHRTTPCKFLYSNSTIYHILTFNIPKQKSLQIHNCSTMKGRALYVLKRCTSHYYMCGCGCVKEKARVSYCLKIWENHPI